MISAARELKYDPSIEFVFLGEGAAKQSLEDAAGDLFGKTVHFEAFRSQQKAEEFVRNTDLSLITLSPGCAGPLTPARPLPTSAWAARFSS